MRVPESTRDLALNEAEVSRVLATERIDPDAARLMLWALDLSASTLRAELRSHARPPAKPNGIYHVPLNPLFEQTYLKNLSEVLENTDGQGEGTRFRMVALQTEEM
jgi:hypothetical protein